MKTQNATLSAMSNTTPPLPLPVNPDREFFSVKKFSIIKRAIALILFAALISFSKNSSACSASFVDSIYGTSVQFINTSVAANSAYWYWTFGDGTWSDLENPVHVYNAYGPFLVCLTVYDTANNCTNTHCDSVYLSNNLGCQAYFNYSANGLTVDFTNLSTGNYTSVIWEFGDNSTSLFNNPSHTYAISGYYYVCVTVSDTGVNCNDTYCQYIYVNDSAQQCGAAFNYTGNGTTIQFFNNSFSCNYANWFWTFGDGGSSSDYNPSHQYASAGYYNVCLSMYDSYCACADTVCDTIYVGGNYLPCTAEFVLYPDSFQQGLYWGYNYSIGNNLVYYWWWGDGAYSTGPYPSHVYADSGYYTICLSILDTISQCSDSVCSDYLILKQEKLDQIHEVIFVNATGVPPVSVSKNIQWSIFPNPASNAVTIQTNADKIDAISISDVSGKVMKQVLSYDGGIISLESLPQGVYIVRTYIDGGWSSKLFIKQ